MESNQSEIVADKKEILQVQEKDVTNSNIKASENVVNSHINAAEEIQETPEQINWRKFREQREIERKQKLEAERKAAEKEVEASALKAAMDAILNKKSHDSSTVHEEVDEEETEDQRIEKKINAAIQIREQQLEEKQRQREAAEYPQKLVSAYKDFNQVCSADNLDYLEYHYPEIAKAFGHMPDGFDKWASVYQAVKRFVPNTESKKEQAKAERNFAKPQSMAVSGATQTGDNAPIYLDDKRRSDNWARMQRVMKGGR
jgi:hypothetical protein